MNCTWNWRPACLNKVFAVVKEKQCLAQMLKSYRRNLFHLFMATKRLQKFLLCGFSCQELIPDEYNVFMMQNCDRHTLCWSQLLLGFCHCARSADYISVRSASRQVVEAHQDTEPFYYEDGRQMLKSGAVWTQTATCYFITGKKHESFIMC